MLRVESLRASYGDLLVLHDIAIEVPSASVTLMLGRNGAGKTTLLHSLAGLHRSHGRIDLDGRELGGLPSHKRIEAGIGIVQEGKRIFKGRTVHENLLLGGYTVARRGGWLTGKRAVRPRVEQAYERFPMLASRRSMVAGRLSGGQQQMLAIAQALITEPTVLLLDEPSAGLAPVIAQEVFALVRDLADNGMAVLLVEQVIESSLNVADTVAVLDGGRVISQGVASEFNEARIVEHLYAGR
jgi:branched-chain amino acid transport system ATP-binding protein